MDASDKVRQQILDYMRQERITQKELATKLGKSPQALNTTLHKRKGVTAALMELLDGLGLELYVRPKPD